MNIVVKPCISLVHEIHAEKKYRDEVYRAQKRNLFYKGKREQGGKSKVIREYVEELSV